MNDWWNLNVHKWWIVIDLNQAILFPYFFFWILNQQIMNMLWTYQYSYRLFDFVFLCDTCVCVCQRLTTLFLNFFFVANNRIRISIDRSIGWLFYFLNLTTSAGRFCFFFSKKLSSIKIWNRTIFFNSILWFESKFQIFFSLCCCHWIYFWKKISFFSLLFRFNSTKKNISFFSIFTEIKICTPNINRIYSCIQ